MEKADLNNKFEAVTTGNHKRLHRGICLHCGRGVSFDWVSGAGYFSSETEIESHDGKSKLKMIYGFLAAQCPLADCRKVTIYQRNETELGRPGYASVRSTLSEGVIYPIPSARPSLPTDVPSHLRDLFDEAAKIEPLSSNGAGFLARRILEQTLRSELKKKRNLRELVDEFLERPDVPPSLRKLMDPIRLFGNLAAHPNEIDDGEWESLDSEEAGYVLDLVERLMDFLYVEPAKDAAMLKRLEGRRKPNKAAG